ncbi:hypothetical protein D3C86_1016490 [compost metagenome]
MLRYVDDGSTVFTAERQSLQHTHGDKQYRRSHADLCVAGQQADGEGGNAHQCNGHHEGVLAPDDVSNSTEDECAEGANCEAGGKAEQREYESSRRIYAGKDVGRDLRSQRASKEKVVPLKHGTKGGCKDNPPLRLVLCCGGRIGNGAINTGGHEASPFLLSA